MRETGKGAAGGGQAMRRDISLGKATLVMSTSAPENLHK